MDMECEVILQTDSLPEIAHLMRRLQEPSLSTFDLLHGEWVSQEDVSPFTVWAEPDRLLVVLLNDLYLLANMINIGIKPSAVLTGPIDLNRVRESYLRILSQYRAAVVQTAGKISLSFGRKTYRLSPSMIVYIEAMEKKVNIYTKLQCITVTQSLYEVKTILDERFIQCHRSYLVNVDSVVGADYANMELELSIGARIPISRNCRKAVEERLSSADDG